MKDFALFLRANSQMSSEAFSDLDEIKLRGQWLEKIKAQDMVVNLGGTMPPIHTMAATIFSDGSSVDGAFSEVSHFLTGYLIIKAADLESAKQIAISNPILKAGGSVEIREIILRQSMKLLEALNWRYATKRMTGEKLDEETVDQIVEAARLSPSSAGLQPLHVFVISNPQLKQKIQAVALGQPQIVESSHLLVFTSWDTITDEAIEKVHANMNALRQLPREKTVQTEDNLKQLFRTFSDEEQYHHTAKQAHIAFGMAIAAAAELGVDATPMEGFNKNWLDELLDLRSKGLRSVVLLALGRRKVEADWLFPLKKYRQPIEEFRTEIK